MSVGRRWLSFSRGEAEYLKRHDSVQGLEAGPEKDKGSDRSPNICMSSHKGFVSHSWSRLDANEFPCSGLSGLSCQFSS